MIGKNSVTILLTCW